MQLAIHEETDMLKQMLSIRGHNLFGNIATGACLLALSITRPFPTLEGLYVVSAAGLLVLAILSLRSCLSCRHESPDEMSLAHDGQASSHALKITLIVVGTACAGGMVTGAKVDLAMAGCATIGLAMLTYGVSFAILEGGDELAEDEDA